MAEVQLFDGVALATLGDTLVIVYQAPARLHRSRWAYDRADEHAEANPKGTIGLMIVLPSADAPDGPTRMENRNRLRKLSPVLRQLVTVPVGDEFRVSIVRAIMRTMVWMQGQTKLLPVENTLEAGVSTLLALATPRTPSRQQVQDLIVELYRALELEPPVFARQPAQKRMG